MGSKHGKEKKPREKAKASAADLEESVAETPVRYPGGGTPTITKIRNGNVTVIKGSPGKVPAGGRSTNRDIANSSLLGLGSIDCTNNSSLTSSTLSTPHLLNSAGYAVRAAKKPRDRTGSNISMGANGTTTVLGARVSKRGVSVPPMLDETLFGISAPPLASSSAAAAPPAAGTGEAPPMHLNKLSSSQSLAASRTTSLQPLSFCNSGSFNGTSTGGTPAAASLQPMSRLWPELSSDRRNCDVLKATWSHVRECKSEEFSNFCYDGFFEHDPHTRNMFSNNELRVQKKIFPEVMTRILDDKGAVSQLGLYHAHMNISPEQAQVFGNLIYDGILSCCLKHPVTRRNSDLVERAWRDVVDTLVALFIDSLSSAAAITNLDRYSDARDFRTANTPSPTSPNPHRVPVDHAGFATQITRDPAGAAAGGGGGGAAVVPLSSASTAETSPCGAPLGGGGGGGGSATSNGCREGGAASSSAVAAAAPEFAAVRWWVEIKGKYLFYSVCAGDRPSGVVDLTQCEIGDTFLRAPGAAAAADAAAADAASSPPLLPCGGAAPPAPVRRQPAEADGRAEDDSVFGTSSATPESDVHGHACGCTVEACVPPFSFYIKPVLLGGGDGADPEPYIFTFDGETDKEQWYISVKRACDRFSYTRPFAVGQACRVKLTDTSAVAGGTCLWMGAAEGTPFARQGKGLWVGVEMDSPVASGHAGTFMGRKFFECESGRGVLVPAYRAEPATESPGVRTRRASLSSVWSQGWGGASTTTGTTEQPTYAPSDFDFLRILGRGSYGCVCKVREKSTGQIYACKILQKAALVEEDQVPNLYRERSILLQVRHPYIVRLHAAFQTKARLLLLFDFLSGGELWFHLSVRRKDGLFTSFGEDRSLFYFAEVALALGYLHSMSIIHRDLKLENLVLDAEGHVVLTDFGFAKAVDATVASTTQCGTLPYMAPEVLSKQGYSKEVDWWSLGVVTFIMMTGYYPYWVSKENGSLDTAATRELIVNGRPIQTGGFPEGAQLSDASEDLCCRLLRKDATNRLSSVEDVTPHRAFTERAFDWNACRERRVPPPFVPNALGKNTKYFSDFSKNQEVRRLTVPSNDEDAMSLGHATPRTKKFLLEDWRAGQAEAPPPPAGTGLGKEAAAAGQADGQGGGDAGGAAGGDASGAKGRVCDNPCPFEHFSGVRRTSSVTLDAYDLDNVSYLTPKVSSLYVFDSYDT